MNRNYGIDLLRIVSMIMIVVLHVLGHGGVLASSKGSLIGYGMMWFLEIAAYCAVNCYALVSGYVGYGTRFKYENIMVLYLQVVFWILIIQGGFALFVPGSVGLMDFIKALFPFAVNTYWYFSAYFCMFFFIPFLNQLMDSMNKKQATGLIITIVFLFSILPSFFHNDMFKNSNGSSTFWLTMLYLMGAYIKKYDLGKKEQTSRFILLYLGCVIVNWISQYGVEQILHYDTYSSALVNYVSPTVLLSAVALLIVFKNINVGNVIKKIVMFFSPVSFGVYLIHDEPLVRQYVISQRFANYGSLSPLFMVLAVLGTVGGIWLAGSLLDYIRLKIFKLLKVKNICIRIKEIICLLPFPQKENPKMKGIR